MRLVGGLWGLAGGVINHFKGYDFWEGFAAGFVGGWFAPLGIGGAIFGSFASQFFTSVANGANPVKAAQRAFVSACITGIGAGIGSIIVGSAFRDQVALNLMAFDADAILDIQ